MLDKNGNELDLGNYIKHPEFGYGKIIYIIKQHPKYIPSQKTWGYLWNMTSEIGYDITCEEWGDSWVSSSEVGLINNDAIFRYIATKSGYLRFNDINNVKYCNKFMQVTEEVGLNINLSYSFNRITISCQQKPVNSSDFIMSKEIIIQDNLVTPIFGNLEEIIKNFEDVCKKIYYLSQAI